MTIEELLSGAQADRVRAALNVLVEAPYFYKSDDPDLFLFIRRYQREFNAFFEMHFGWQLLADVKCARLYKPEWYNEKVTPANRDLFRFTRRDDCIAFMLLLEFFESKVEEESIALDDPENYRFRYGDLLAFEETRFRELFPDAGETYSDENVRKELRQIFPALERYRLLQKIDPPSDEPIATEDTIYECLPALWHYRAEELAKPIPSTIGNT